MDFMEKAKIRLDHWIGHNKHHCEDYEAFANELEEAGKPESAKHMREMKALTIKSTECLKKAREALD